MPLSSHTITFPDPLPAIGTSLECVRGASASGLIRGDTYRLVFVIRNAVTKNGDGASGYVVSTSESNETLPNVWNPARFRAI